MTKATKIIVMICLTFAQYMKPRMQLLQERLGYDLTITSVKFMQQTTSPSSEGDSSVCN